MDRPKGIRLRAPSATEDDFVAAFHAFSDETSIFIPTDKLYPTNTNCYFSLELADETPMLRGLGVVIDSWSTTENPFDKPGMRVGITQLTAQSETVFDRLLATRPTLEKRGPRTRNAPMTQQQWGAVIAPPTQEMEVPIPFEDGRPPTEEPVRPITRELRASLPPVNAMASSAAPIASLDDKATETQRYDISLRLPARSPAAAKSARTGANPIPAGPQTTPLDIVDLIEEDDIRLPSSWWQARYWRDGAWRTSWWATTWRDAQWNKASRWKTAWGNAQWRKASWWRDGSWRDAWWASWWWKAQWRKAEWWRNGSWRTALQNNRRTVKVFAFGMLVGVFMTVVLRPASDVTRDQVATADQANHTRDVIAGAKQPISMDDATASEAASSLAVLPNVARTAPAPGPASTTAVTKASSEPATAVAKPSMPRSTRPTSLARATPNTTSARPTAAAKPTTSATLAKGTPTAKAPAKPPTPASVLANATRSSALAKAPPRSTARPSGTSTALTKPSGSAASAMPKPTARATGLTKPTPSAKPSSAKAKPAPATTLAKTTPKSSATSSALAKPRAPATTQSKATKTTTKGSNVATRKAATKRGKRGCTSLDCI